jgi:hypothetical protein
MPSGIMVNCALSPTPGGVLNGRNQGTLSRRIPRPIPGRRQALEVQDPA